MLKISQQKCSSWQLQGELSLETGEISDSVADLVEHVWQEAVGELDTILSVPIEAVTRDQVLVQRLMCDFVF